MSDHPLFSRLPQHVRQRIQWLSGLAEREGRTSPTRALVELVPSLLAGGFSEAEAAQAELVYAGIRCAMLFERPVRPAMQRAILPFVSLVCVDGYNMFGVNACLLRDRFVEDGLNLARGAPPTLPALVFAGCHNPRPLLATREEKFSWSGRLAEAAKRLVTAIEIANVKGLVAEVTCVTPTACGDDVVSVCPVSLTGWLLEYPVIYDVCGPYPLPGPLVLAASVVDAAAAPVAMLPGNCLAGVPLLLQTATVVVASPSTLNVARTLVEVPASDRGVAPNRTRAVVSFSFPLHLASAFVNELAHWRARVRLRLKRVGGMLLVSSQECVLDAVSL